MSFKEAMRTTLEEFEIYNMAYAIRQEDKRLNSAIQAWFNQSVKAQKGKGKSARPAFKTFEEFYNHKEEFEKIFRKNQPEKEAIPARRLDMAERNRLINQAKKGGS